MIETTDHLAVSLKLNSPVKRGPGYWKSITRIYKTQTINETNYKYMQAWTKYNGKGFMGTL